MRFVFGLVLALFLTGCNQVGQNQRDSAQAGRNQKGGGVDGQSNATPANSLPAAPDSAAAVTPPNTELNVGDWLVGKPLRHANLTIFPVSSRVPKNEDRFITLDAGLKAGTVEVR
jgi:hypothetical protein